MKIDENISSEIFTVIWLNEKVGKSEGKLLKSAKKGDLYCSMLEVQCRT